MRTMRIDGHPLEDHQLESHALEGHPLEDHPLEGHALESHVLESYAYGFAIPAPHHLTPPLGTARGGVGAIGLV